jgi:hypothetical protein
MSTQDLPTIPDLGTPPQQPAASLPFYFAVLVDNKVYRIFNVDAETASVFNANPTFVHISSDETVTGATYNPVTKTFSVVE